MSNKFLFAGTFNPYTIGHHSVYETASTVLTPNEVVLGIAQNPNKPGIEPQLLKWRMNPAFPGITSTSVKVVTEPLLAHYASSIGAKALIRSLRNSIDLVHETDQATWNKEFGIDTIYVPSDKDLDHVSSSAVRELYSLGRDMRDYFVNDIHYNRYVECVPTRIIVTGKMGSGKSSYIKDYLHRYEVVDLDKVVKERLDPKHSETFRRFFADRDISEIRHDWFSRCSDEHLWMAQRAVIDIVKEELDKEYPMRVYEASAFTAYSPMLDAYLDDSIFVYVDKYDNGKQRDIDETFMRKTHELQTYPEVIDYVINLDNGKFGEVTGDIMRLVDAVRNTKC